VASTIGVRGAAIWFSIRAHRHFSESKLARSEKECPMFRHISTPHLSSQARAIGLAVSAALITSVLRAPLFLVSADTMRSGRQAEEIRPLLPGPGVEREISAATRHLYRIALEAGEYVEASLDQNGIEVVALVNDAEGRTICEFVEPAAGNGTRKILFVAQSGGDHYLLVRPRLKDGAPGRYRLTLETQRPATEPDKIRARATRLTNETSQSLRKSITPSGEDAASLSVKIEEAIQLWRALDETGMVGEGLLSLGIVSQRTGELTKALGFYEQAMPLFSVTAPESASKATTLNNMANIYLALGETRKALEVFLRSLDLKKGESRSRAITLDNIGAVYALLGEYQLALDHHLQALESLRRLGARRDEASALNNLAWLWQNIGDMDKSIECLLQALPLVREAGDKAGEALYLTNAGYFYHLQGDHQKALDYANRSFTLGREINNHRALSGSLTLLCKVYPALGDFERGLDACERVLRMNQDGRDSISKATTYATFSRVLEQTGARRKAVESGEAALALYRAIGDPTGEIMALHALGQYALEDGDLDSAGVRLERAIELAESQRVKVDSHQLRSTFMAGRQQVYESYIDLSMLRHRREPGKGYDRIALQVSERARARGLLDLLAEARARIRRGADAALLEEERLLLERLNAKDAALKQLRNNGRMNREAEALIRELDETNTRLQWIESKIRASSPRYSELTQPKSLTPEEIQRQLLDANTILLEFSLGEKRSWLWAVSPAETLARQLPARQEIESRARNVYALLVARQPKKGDTEAEYHSRVTRAEEEFSREAGSLSRMLLGPIAAKLRRDWKGKRLLIVAGGALEYVPFAALPIPLSKTEDLDDGATGRRGDEASVRVSDRGANQISGSVAVKEASSRPVAFPPPARPLIVEHEIVNLPSASVLAEIRRERMGRRPASKALAVIADPVFEPNDSRVLIAAMKNKAELRPGVRVRSAEDDSPAAPRTTISDLALAIRGFDRAGFSRLPFSREEADKITEFIPRGSLLKAMDFRANREVAVSGELGHYRIVHFATHGLLNSERPELSGLVLSLVDENGKAQDGFLRMREIFNLQLSADLVVLSACQTALGKEIKGEGLVGLTRGFMYAGAERVIASLWQVDDLATAELMKRVYRGMLKDGMRPAAALRAAQVELMSQPRWGAPYYWAAFEIQGEWR
jgi:CHAT domain-containing protein/tetratricopeptide (TPR) repeat protein